MPDPIQDWGHPKTDLAREPKDRGESRKPSSPSVFTPFGPEFRRRICRLLASSAIANNALAPVCLFQHNSQTLGILMR